MPTDRLQIRNAILKSMLKSSETVRRNVSYYVILSSLHEQGYLVMDGAKQCLTEESQENANIACEVINDLIRCGILCHFSGHPNFTSGNALEEIRCNIASGSLRVTDYGKQVILGDESVSYDPEGYLASVKDEAPGLSELEIEYLTESIHTFHLCRYRASVVMLGCASEALLLRVITDTASRLPKPEKIEKKKGISEKFEEWKEQLDQNWSKVIAGEGSSRDETLRLISHMFDIIRLSRNEQGHPTGQGVNVDRLELMTLLAGFGRYAKTLLDLQSRMQGVGIH